MAKNTTGSEGERLSGEHGEDTDIQAILENYISITPIHLDLTNYEAMNFLKERLKLDIEDTIGR